METTSFLGDSAMENEIAWTTPQCCNFPSQWTLFRDFRALCVRAIWKIDCFSISGPIERNSAENSPKNMSSTTTFQTQWQGSDRYKWWWPRTMVSCNLTFFVDLKNLSHYFCSAVILVGRKRFGFDIFCPVEHEKLCQID